MNKSFFFLLLSLVFSMANANAQTTYSVGDTEYLLGDTYESTGLPKVKRSSANRQTFLESLGLDRVPDGYEVDHITPLFQGGTDSPWNMQLLTKEQHAQKTARERSSSRSFHSSSPIMPSYPSTSSTRIYQTGPRGGQYYINASGNKVYSRK